MSTPHHASDSPNTLIMKNQPTPNGDNQGEKASTITSRGVNIPLIDPFLAKELVTAAGRGHLNLIKWFLEHRLLDTELCCEILCAASHKGHIRIVQLMLDNGSDVQYDDNRPLFLAVIGEHLAIIRLLLRCGARSTFSDASSAATSGHHLHLGLLMPSSSWTSGELDQLIGIAGATADAINSIECIQIVVRYCSTSYLVECLARKSAREYEENPGLNIVQLLAHQELRFRRYMQNT